MMISTSQTVPALCNLFGRLDALDADALAYCGRYSTESCIENGWLSDNNKSVM